MDRIEQQIHSLNRKVDGLYHLIEDLTTQVAECHWHTPTTIKEEREQFSSVSQYKEYAESSWIKDSDMNHKDILVDNQGWENYADPCHDKGVSSDIQIRRLTTQLTAAYNRIAALEEQILAKRIHS